MKTFLSTRFTFEHIIEFRAIRGAQARLFFATLAQVGAFYPSLRKLDANGWNIYAGVNPRAKGVVCELVSFHADIDAPRLASLEKAHKERDLVERLESVVPVPSVTVDSGHGLHFYWILEKSLIVTDANRERLKAINRGLALACGGDAACCDVTRILRIPGFHNHKSNPPIEVRLLSSTGPRYPIGVFESFAVGQSLPGAGLSASSPPSNGPVSEELDRRYRRLWGRNPEIKRGWRGEIGDGSSDSRYVLVKHLRAHGFTDDEILAVVLSRRTHSTLLSLEP